jgi:hypothetical protein
LDTPTLKLTPTNIVRQHVSIYGTSHPVVARLLMQSRELLPWAGLPNEKQDVVYGIHYELKNRLLKCHESYTRLLAEKKRTLQTPQLDPYLIGLKNEAETFLYDSKNYFRDLLGIINVFFRTNFKEARDFYDASGKGDGELTGWASRQFGPTDPFTEMLRTEQDWIGELIRKRNAVEHPGEYSGTLTIENFTPRSDGRFTPPSWHRDNLSPTDLLADIEVAMDNMLTLAEDILVACITKTTKWPIIKFVAIPEQDRKPDCPMRIIVQLREP